MQPRVLRLIDHTRAAATKLLDDAVVRDGLAEHLQECYGARSGLSMHGLHGSFAYPALASFRMGYRVGVFPEGEEVLTGGAGLCIVRPRSTRCRKHGATNTLASVSNLMMRVTEVTSVSLCPVLYNSAK